MPRVFFPSLRAGRCIVCDVDEIAARIHRARLHASDRGGFGVFRTTLDGRRPEMPLQNRVNPFGEIVATPERGTMVGNRGVLHGDQRNIVRVSQVRRWISCRLEWKGIRRTVMTPRAWTELFFLQVHPSAARRVGRARAPGRV